ncbi:AmiS/UreI family transporter [Microtetraspora sp. AC03309]|uniref:AmiS/UreI family transporter n=1 Tax=Microtetraspora sp. AC03309 TaxID=2779376 RepID=UPI001E56F82E|nr:AmiS/UreI family transporter [Microtetraspora sp. AC03309]
MSALRRRGAVHFAFTHLYVGLTILGGFDTTGTGYFSLFVAITALGYSYANFQILGNPPFGVIWLSWSVPWFFFLSLGLKSERLTRYPAWVAAIEGWVPGLRRGRVRRAVAAH